MVRLRQKLSPAVLKVFSFPNASEWYPISWLVEIEKAACELFYGGDYREAWRFGYYDLEVSVSRIYRFLFRFLEPTFLFERTTKLWNTLVDQGRVVLDNKSNPLTISFHDVHPPHSVYCHDVRGSLMGSLAACGAKDIVVDHPECVLQGKPACVYRGTFR